ncbi:MAG: hypothetical protein KGJ89_00005, partial [Patescibacteria group bacterium]|nr:hypothetical protein [Patescibacteria group bacterium]MDE2014905.1 hypothetical protein [Patescibacteria group bacterium]MDE2226334.1 hypothetical protein [Patescibacteria group bacterium]
MKKFYKEFTNKLVNEPTAFKQSLKIIRTSINKTSLLFISLSAVFLLFTAYSLLPTNFSFAQTCSPGQNCSAINIDTTNNNLAIGTSSTQTDTKLLIVGTSTTNGYFAIKVLNLNTGPLFIVRSDGSVTIGSNLALTSQQGTATGTISGVGTPPTNGSLYVNGPIFTTLDLKASGIAVGTTTPQSGGNILATGIITGTNLGGTVPASNVTAGTFSDAANYYFQSGLGVGTTTASLGRLQIDDTANTGIYINGNSSGNAQTELYIDRNSSGSGILTGPNIRLNDHTATDANVIQNSQGALTFWNYGSNSWLERMRIASSGNVGIGTTAPNSQLTISGATGETTAAINTTGPQPGTLLIADTGSVAGNGGQIIFAADGGANSAWQFAGIKGLVNNGTASSTGDLAFATRHATGDAAFTEDMRIIGTTGNLAIATTSAASTLTVQGTAFVSGALTVGSCTGCGGGITSLNGLSGASQTFATSSGSGFNITSSGSTHTFQYDSDIIQIATLAPTKGNLVVGNGSWAALAVGANNKALMASSTATNGVSWESVPGGSGTTNSVPLWSAGTTLGNSLITQPGASAINIGSGGLGVGTTTAQTTGNIYATGNITAAGSLVGTFAGTVAAANVTAGLFNGGNYYFPSGLGVNTSTAGTLPVSGGLNVYGGGYFQNGVMINRPNLIGSTDLSVSGNTTNGEAIGFIGGDRGWIIGQGGTEFPVGGIGFRDTFASSTRMVIDSSGNVGIGTTTAASALNVYTSSGESAVNIEAPRYPKVYFKGDGGGTDAKLWQMYADTGSATTTNVFLLAALNDAGAGQSIAMRVSRTANVINYVDFPAGTVWADGGTNALPTAAGSSLTETALRVSGGAAAASIDFGSAGSVPAGWIQARNSTNYALNYAILLNPNGGNVGIGDSSPSTKLEVAGNVSSTGLCLGGTCNTAWPNSSQWTTSGSNI